MNHLTMILPNGKIVTTQIITYSFVSKFLNALLQVGEMTLWVNDDKDSYLFKVNKQDGGVFLFSVFHLGAEILRLGVTESNTKQQITQVIGFGNAFKTDHVISKTPCCPSIAFEHYHSFVGKSLMMVYYENDLLKTAKAYTFATTLAGLWVGFEPEIKEID